MNEQLVVKYVLGEVPAPERIAPIVEEYNMIRQVIDDPETVSWPRDLDRRMNELYDRMVVEVGR